MPIPKFFGKIERGKLKLWNREALDSYLASLKDGDYELVVKERSQVRSNELNKYLWGVVFYLISEHTGYTKEEVKELMKKDFGLKDEDGSLKSTSKYTNKQMLAFIDEVRRFWAENDLYIPDPNAVEVSNG